MQRSTQSCATRLGGIVSKLSGKLAAFAAAVLLGAAGSASAEIVNIDATSQAGTQFTFTQAGQYEIRWIGTAEGGLYDAAYVECVPTPSGCMAGWSNGFSAVDVPFNPADFYVDLHTTRAVYQSAAESLAAYQSGTVYHDFARVQAGVVTETGSEGVTPRPWIVTASGGETFTLRVLDHTNQSRVGNLGGVSLSINQVAPVPEPTTWALMILGFGSAGAMLRRRRSAFA
jgi:hypothetical protein